MSVEPATINGKVWKSESFKVVPFNYLPEVQQQYNFREPLVIRDHTPEKMDRLEGARLYSAEEYLEVCQLLVEAGISETKFLTFAYDGTPRGERIMAGLSAVSKAGLNLKCYGNDFFFGAWLGKYEGKWVRDQYKTTLDRLADAGATGVDLALLPSHYPSRPIWDGKLHEEVFPEFAEALKHFPKAVEYAKKKGLTVLAPAHLKRVHPDDFTTLSGFTSMLNFYIEHGADGVNLSDANGACSPDAARWFITKVRSQLSRDVPVYYHVHDTFGMATAQCIAAISAGAYPQPSVNGVADRGFPCLDEMVAALEMLYGVKTGINLKKMPELSRVVQRITGVSMPPFKAVVGDLITMPYSPETQIAMLTQGKTWTEIDGPYHPSTVGLRPNFGISYAGLHPMVVGAVLEKMKLPTNEEAIEKAYVALKQRLDAFGNRFPIVLSEGDVESACREATRG